MDNNDNDKIRSRYWIGLIGLLLVPAVQALDFLPALPAVPLAGPGAGQLATGDFNGDGRVDLAVTTDPVGFSLNQDGINILLGNGAGGFTQGAPLRGAQGLSAIVSGDFNGDGNVDLAAAESIGTKQAASAPCLSLNSQVPVYLGDGLGGFNFSTCLAAGTVPRDLVWADLTGDGISDLVVASDPGGVDLFPGLAGGGFGPRQRLYGFNTAKLAAGDLDADGDIDLVVVSGTQVIPLLNDGLGGMSPGMSLGVSLAIDVALGDFDGDGHLDVAVLGLDRFWIGWGTGTGQFAVGSAVVVGGAANGFLARDLNGDGLADVAVTRRDLGDVALFEARPLRGFLLERLYPVGTTPFALGAADVDGDGLVDLIVTNRNQAPDGTFQDGTLSLLPQRAGVPRAQGDRATTLEDQAVDIPVLANDRDTPANGVTGSLVPGSIQIEVKPAHGSAVTAPSGLVTYTPAPNFNGPDRFVYRVADDSGLLSNAVMVTIDVTPVNDPPAPTAAPITLVEGATARTLVHPNDPDIGDTHTFAISLAPAHGQASLSASGLLTYTSALGYRGTDRVDVSVTDAGGLSGLVSIPVTIVAGNHPPVAQDGTLTLAEDSTGTGTLTARDVDGDPLSYRIVNPPLHGTVTLTGTGPGYSYQPDPNYNGPDGFSFVANDGTVDSAAATVTIDVTPVNDPPVAQARTLTLAEDSTGTGTLLATDVDGDPLTYRIINPPLHGTVRLTGTGSGYSYQPDPNYNGPDRFSYLASDGMTVSNQATVALQVLPVNDVPVARDAHLKTKEDTPGTGTLLALDVDGDPLDYRVTQRPSHGRLSLNGRQYHYVPALDYNGPDSFRFVANDGKADSAAATITIDVTPVNDPPRLEAVGVSRLDLQPGERREVGLKVTDPDTGDSYQYEPLPATALASLSLIQGSSDRLVLVAGDAAGTETLRIQVRDRAGAQGTLVLPLSVAAPTPVPSQAGGGSGGGGGGGTGPAFWLACLVLRAWRGRHQ